MATTSNKGQGEGLGINDKWLDLADKGKDGRRWMASIATNPDNENECLLIMPKDYVEGYTYKDYIELGRNLSKRY